VFVAEEIPTLAKIFLAIGGIIVFVLMYGFIGYIWRFLRFLFFIFILYLMVKYIE